MISRNDRLFAWAVTLAVAVVLFVVCACLNVFASGPGPIPFNPVFVSGSGPTGCTPNNQLCFNTSSSPYKAYVWNPFAGSWEQYGGSGGTGCSASAGDLLYSVAGTDCTGASLKWNGSELVWAANGRVDDPGDINTSGGFNIISGGGGNIEYVTGLDISVTGGAINIGSSSSDVSISSSIGTLLLSGATVSLNGNPFSVFATANPTAATAALNLFTSTLQGLVPASGGGTSNFLRADGAWAAPPGGATITWPANGSAVISNTTNSPAGVAEIDGKALVGVSGAWIAGDIPASSVSGGLCTSTAGAVQYNNSGAAGCAPLIYSSGMMEFTGLNFGVNGAPFFSGFQFGGIMNDFCLGPGACTNYTTVVGTVCIGGLACQDVTSPAGADTALGYAACGSQSSTSGGYDTCIGGFAGAGLSGSGSTNNTLIGWGAGQFIGGANDDTAVGYDACPGNATGYVCLGYEAGSSVNSSGGDILIGFEAAPNLTSGSNIICISASYPSSGCGTLATGANDIMFDATPNGCNFSAAGVSNEFDICGNATSSLPIVRANIASSAAGNWKFNVPDASPGYTVATLPAAPPQGSRAFVTDAVVCTFLASLTGGGSAFCPVTYNGSAWVGG
jgi:hypothetical protein